MFNWFSSRSKTSLPEPTALQAQKSRQIDQLKAFNQNVSEIHRDVEYRVNTVVNSTSISLYITLPPQFPQEKPVVKVTPRVSHPWINDQMIIHGSPGINNFMVHSDLGKVINEVIQEFQQNPPTVLPSEYNFGGAFPYATTPAVTTISSSTVTAMPHHSRYPTPATTTTTPASAANQQPAVPSYISSLPVSLPYGVTGPTTGPPNYGMPNLGSSTVLAQDQNAFHNNTSPVGGYKMPDMPMTMPLLAELGKQDLLELLDNEEKLLQMIEALPELKKVNCDRETLAEQNEQLARQNLSHKPILEEKKKILLEKFDAFNDVKSRYDESCRRQEDIRQKYDPRHIQDNLKVAALQAEEVSEGIAETFLEGKITTDEFKKSFMDKRKLSHLRKAKEERLGQCLTNQSRGGF